MTRKRHLINVGASIDIRLSPSDIKDFDIDKKNLDNYEVDIEDIKFIKKKKLKNDKKKKNKSK